MFVFLDAEFILQGLLQGLQGLQGLWNRPGLSHWYGKRAPYVIVAFKFEYRRGFG